LPTKDLDFRRTQGKATWSKSFKSNWRESPGFTTGKFFQRNSSTALSGCAADKNERRALRRSIRQRHSEDVGHSIRHHAWPSVPLMLRAQHDRCAARDLRWHRRFWRKGREESKYSSPAGSAGFRPEKVKGKFFFSIGLAFDGFATRGRRSRGPFGGASGGFFATVQPQFAIDRDTMRAAIFHQLETGRASRHPTLRQVKGTFRMYKVLDWPLVRSDHLERRMGSSAHQGWA